MADVKALADIVSEQTTIADGDLFFVESGGTAAKITTANLKTATGIDALEARPLAGSTLIASVTAAAASEVVFDQFDDTLYSGYVFGFTSVSSSVDQDNIFARTSSTGAAPFDNGAADYNWSDFYVSDLGGTAPGGGSGTNLMQIGTAIRTSTKDFNGDLTVRDPENAASATVFEGRFTHTRNLSFGGTFFNGRRNGLATVNAIQFKAVSGTLTGYFTMHGILK